MSNKEMSSAEYADYAAYSDELARGEGRPDHSAVVMRESVGPASDAELEDIFVGRPRDDVQQVLKKTWQLRVPDLLDNSVQDLARQEGMSKSAFIRQTLAERVRRSA